MSDTQPVCFCLMINMWILYLLFCAVVPTLSRKEYPDLDTIPKNERKLLLELVKRLQKSDDDGLAYQEPATSSRYHPAASQQCVVTTNSSAIIKRKNSEDNGAKFITLEKDIVSNEACSKLCCEKTMCDMAVYEDKGDRYCYLFSCQDLCEFGYHTSYMSNWIRHTEKASAIAPEGSEQEEDLAGLGDGLQEAREEEAPANDVESSSTSTSVQPIMPQTTTVTPTAATESLNIRAHSVGLNGTCGTDVHCEDPNSMCRDNHCRCQESFYEKNHICREVCTPSSFECLELGTHGRGPQCVAGAQVCDGVTNCADGSDEFNCPPDADTPYKAEPVGVHGASVKPSKQDAVSSARVQGQKDESSDDSQNTQPKHTAAQRPEVKDHVGDSSVSRTPLPAVQSSVMPSRLLTPATTISTESKAVDENSQNNGGSSSKETKFPQGVKPEAAAGKSDHADTSIFVTKEEISFSGITADKQGPIIALSLGLVFTLILLVFVACRLRTVRHRLRKGRPLHSNEADYLINGMYL